jgi:hypothetical protein
MKVKITPAEGQKSLTFPCIMEHTGPGSRQVVLFIDADSGILLASSNRPESVGTIEDDWIPCTDRAHWKPFLGEVLISN